MPRTLHRLTPLRVSKIKGAGMHADGGGLYLQISSPTARSWVFRYQLNGRTHKIGLGSAHGITLGEARDMAHFCRKLKAKGSDPKAHRAAEKAAARREAQETPTFEAMAKTYIKAHSGSWRNPKHRAQWSSSLETYAFPIIGALGVQEIETSHIHRILEKIWYEKTETASRLRGRIESILGYAATAGYREGDNPARWRGHLEHLLPARTKIQKTRHHSALPYPEIADFMTALRQHESASALGLEFLILTAGRVSEVTKATWDEVDLDQRIWTVPAGRMKGGREHRVPLSERAVEILDHTKIKGRSAYLFPGANPQNHLSENAFRVFILKTMGRRDATAHGFRSTFRDWCAERTNYPREVAEMALAHAVGTAVAAAYRRGDLFAKRVRLMTEWARYCNLLVSDAKLLPIYASTVSSHPRAAP